MFLLQKLEMLLDRDFFGTLCICPVFTKVLMMHVAIVAYGHGSVLGITGLRTESDTYECLFGAVASFVFSALMGTRNCI